MTYTYSIIVVNDTNNFGISCTEVTHVQCMTLHKNYDPILDCILEKKNKQKNCKQKTGKWSCKTNKNFVLWIDLREVKHHFMNQDLKKDPFGG